MGEDEGKEQKKDDGDEHKLRKVKLGGGKQGRGGAGGEEDGQEDQEQEEEGQVKPVDPPPPCLCSISYFGLTKYADYRIS